MPDGAIIDLTPSYGTNHTSLTNLYGAIPTDLTNSSQVFALRTSWRGPVLPFLRGNVGLDAMATTSSLNRLGSIGAPPREGDVYVFGEPPPPQINSDSWNTVIASVAAYAEGDISFFNDTLHVVPGGRFEPFLSATNKMIPPAGNNPPVAYTRQDTQIEPRVSVRYAMSPRVTWKAAYGVYHQSPQAEDLSAQFGNPTLGLSSASHYLAGGAFQLTDALAVETTGFYSESSNLAMRNPDESPLVAQALLPIGKGRSYGVQVLVRQQKVGRFFGWVSYSLLRSERQDAPGEAWRLFDYDQTHIFTALGSYDLGAGFEVGARFRAATGYPRTPVIGAYYSPGTNTYEPIFGPHNSIRIPPFYALDVRVAKRLKVGRTDLEVYLDVQNVTNHVNPEEIVYNTAYTQRGYISGLPILPVFGAKWSW
jgi:hypothetical protein